MYLYDVDSIYWFHKVLVDDENVQLYWLHSFSIHIHLLQLFQSNNLYLQWKQIEQFQSLFKFNLQNLFSPSQVNKVHRFQFWLVVHTNVSKECELSIVLKRIHQNDFFIKSIELTEITSENFNRNIHIILKLNHLSIQFEIKQNKLTKAFVFKCTFCKVISPKIKMKTNEKTKEWEKSNHSINEFSIDVNRYLRYNFREICQQKTPQYFRKPFFV